MANSEVREGSPGQLSHAAPRSRAALGNSRQLANAKLERLPPQQVQCVHSPDGPTSRPAHRPAPYRRSGQGRCSAADAGGWAWRALVCIDHSVVGGKLEHMPVPTALWHPQTYSASGAAGLLPVELAKRGPNLQPANTKLQSRCRTRVLTGAAWGMCDARSRLTCGRSSPGRNLSTRPASRLPSGERSRR